MTDMIAVAYANEDTARQALAELRALHTEHSLELTDVLLVTRDEAGAVKIHNEVDPAAAGAVTGALWGGFIGLLLLQPLLGAAVGAAVGGISGAITGDGDQTEFVKQLGQQLVPGHAAVIALIADGTMDKALPRVAQFGGHVLHSSLSTQEELHIRRALSALPQNSN
jgi:uncharacterized membrane protein